MIVEAIKRRLGEAQDEYRLAKLQLERISPKARREQNVNTGKTPEEDKVYRGLVVLDWQIALRRFYELVDKP